MSHIRSRFNKPPSEAMIGYTLSLPFDHRLYRYDIDGSIAHAKMLAKQNIIPLEDAEAICRGLEDVAAEIENRKFTFRTELEDIHMAIEARLFEIIGEVAGRLHTARSRNDQVALDLRLFVKDAVAETIAGISKLQLSLVDLAEGNKDVIMPGYTHLQPAQPVLFAHHLLAYFEMFQRDAERLNDVLKRADVMPLGSGSLTGVAYNIDREFVASELGFSQVSRNSMDAVSDRDFVIEYLAAASVCMMHLSRLAEEIILWASAEFGFIELDDAYTTGSSLMPQKKNPDAAELCRGKTGRIYGHMMAMLTTMKGLPLSYNRDLQEDKEGLFDAVDTLLSSLCVFYGMIGSLKVNKKNMERAAMRGYMLATDIADYLVARGETFRSAHGITAKLTRYATDKDKPLDQLSLDEYRKFSSLFDDDIFKVTAASSIAARNVTGGTSPQQVAKAIARAREIVGKTE
ncbi:MAG TPA: argininosuccinate lyase [Dehalococcoidia bacterium]|nr:argininosuccinate lyase [Dehalococcoidia bacterium]